MRGIFSDQGRLFSYISPEARVPANHPLRKIQKLVRDVLGELNRSLSRLYASEGRPSIPPEQLLSALLLQVFYGIRSERRLMEQSDYTSVPLVRGTFARRAGVGHDEAFEPSAGQTAVIGRAFFGRRDADRGLGLTEELPSEGRQRRCRWRSLLPRTTTQKRYPCEHDRSQLPSLPQGSRAGSEALLYGPCYHGKPAWAGSGRHGHACHRRR